MPVGRLIMEFIEFLCCRRAKIYFWPRRPFLPFTFGEHCIPRWMKSVPSQHTEIGKKAWLFAKLQQGRARKRINATQEAPFSRALYRTSPFSSECLSYLLEMTISCKVREHVPSNKYPDFRVGYIRKSVFCRNHFWLEIFPQHYPAFELYFLPIKHCSIRQHIYDMVPILVLNQFNQCES